jgi:2-polyprenyl-3-methyl-5-hydroxy-6-metoxy-1,4-benzoquinol methylase
MPPTLSRLALALLPLWRRYARLRGAVNRPAILDAHAKTAAAEANAFGIFDGEWSSEIPGFGFGSAHLFDDFRVRWIGEQAGGFAGKRILELGPLEGGHTYMMSRAGARHITAVESNIRAFLKCLITKNQFDIDAKFLLGDFQAYLRECRENFDLVVASGVLYHVSDPAELLSNIARVTSQIGIWTHYYDTAVMKSQPRLAAKFAAAPVRRQFGEARLALYRQEYLDTLSWEGFCGGSATTSYWMTRGSLFAALHELGFRIECGDETTDHRNGPAILLFASR